MLQLCKHDDTDGCASLANIPTNVLNLDAEEIGDRKTESRKELETETEKQLIEILALATIGPCN